MPESSRLEFLEKSSANNFALSDAKNNTTGPLNRGGISYLPLSQKSQRSSFHDRSLDSLNFTLGSEDLCCCYSQEKVISRR